MKSFLSFSLKGRMLMNRYNESDLLLEHTEINKLKESGITPKMIKEELDFRKQSTIEFINYGKNHSFSPEQDYHHDLNILSKYSDFDLEYLLTLYIEEEYEKYVSECNKEEYEK